MAIAYDAVSSGELVPGDSPLTISHICSGTNKLLLVAVSHYAAASSVITGITYNGVALTKLSEAPYNTDLAIDQIWGLLNPDTGTHNIVISFSTNTYIRAVGVSYTGVLQSGLPDAQNSATTASAASSISTSVTTVVDNCWVFCAGLVWTTPGQSTGTTRGTQGASIAYDSNGPKTPAGSYTCTSTANGSYKISNCVVSFAPAIVVTGAPWEMLMTGVGR